MENWMEKYRLNECLVVFSMLLAFLILAIFGQRKTWITTESIMTCISGLMFAVFPRRILILEIKGQLENVEIDVSRFFGLTLLCSGFVWLKTKETRDGTVAISVLQSKIFVSLSLFIIQCFVYFGRRSSISKSKDLKSLEFSEQMVLLGIFPTVMWFLGNLLHLMKSFDFNSFPQHNIWLNNHLKVDAMLTFALSIIFIAFPSQILQYLFQTSGNKVSLHIVRSVGCLNIGNCILSLQAPGFLHERDKKAIFLARIVSCLLQLGFWYSLLFFRESRVLWSGLIFLPLLGNAIIGYFWSGTSIYKPNFVKGKEISKGD